MTDDDGVVVAGGDSPTEPLTVLSLEVLPCGHQDVGGGIELEKLRGPLFCQVVRHHIEGFLAQAQALALHAGGYHLVGLARPHHMGQQSVAAVEDMGDGVDLMGPQGDSRIDADKIQVASVVLPGPDGVKTLVVELAQPVPAALVFPNPVLKLLLDELLLALGDGGLFLVEHGNLVAVLIFNVIKYTDSTEVQGLLQDFVAIDAPGAVGAVGVDAALVPALALHLPLTCVGGVVDADVGAHIPGSLHELIHELLHHVDGKPRGP